MRLCWMVLPILITGTPEVKGKSPVKRRAKTKAPVKKRAKKKTE